MTPAAQLLVRAALDPSFRDRVIGDPDAAFAEFPDLSDADRDVLRRLDGDMLRLLAHATHGVPYTPPEPVVPEAIELPPAPVRHALPEILLRVMPVATVSADGTVTVEVKVAVGPPPPPIEPAPPPPDVTEAVAAIREATADDRYRKILDLARILRHG